jgi:hypothetical protein
MRVSFDLDDTLFVNAAKSTAEKRLKFPLNLIFKERLRLGTVRLLSEIKEQGISLWIYTTSYRSPKYIEMLFRCYGIKIDNIVNGERHEMEVQAGKNESMPSKYPSRYRIDLHIDDDTSVMENGKIYGFRVFLIDNDNKNWVDDILAEIKKINRSLC